MKKNFSISLPRLKAYLYRFADFFIVLITLVLAILIDQNVLNTNVFIFLLVWAVITYAIFEIFGMYRSLIDHIGVQDMLKIFILVFATNGALAAFTFINETYLIPHLGFFDIGHINPLTILFIATTDSFVLVAVRYIKRII